MINVQEMLDQIPEADEVPLPLVGDLIGWDRYTRSHAVRDGVIRTLPKPPGQCAYRLSRDEAVLLVVAAFLAYLGGCAVVAMVRMIRGAGLDPMELVKSIPKT